MPKNNSNFFESKKPWSVTKDELLANYLTIYFVKIFATHKDVLYIDCFAGAGKFEDGKNGSPLIAFDAYKTAYKISKQPQQIYWKFIEAKNYYRQLLINTQHIKNNEVIHGKYEDNIIEILKKSSSRMNVFLYIDPYGTKAMKYDIFDQISKIQTNSLELLINFNSFGFIRDACSALAIESDLDAKIFNDLEETDPTQIDRSQRSIELLNSIAHGNYWIEIINNNKKPNGKCNGIAAEKEFMERYRQELRKLFNYVLDMPILLKDKGRPVYRMIHLTNHWDGCALMAENMLNRSKVHVLEVQRKGKVDLFSNVDQDLEGNFINAEDIHKKLITLLDSYKGKKRLSEIIADFYTEYGALCKLKALKDILKDMGTNKEIVIECFDGSQKSEDVFMTEKSNKTVWIGRAK